MTASQRTVQSVQSGTLVDVLDRVLDKGLVVAGDIKIKLLDVELLTVQVRLVVCSVERAIEMGMDFWRTDPNLSPLARTAPPPPALQSSEPARVEPPLAEGLARRVAELEAVVAKLETANPPAER